MKLDVKKILPHREPFLFVDEIIEVEPLKRAIGKKHIDPELDFFRGHFPQQKLMPGVLIIEAMAQVGAIALLSHPDYQGKLAYFTGIEKAKFRKMVRPGDILVIHCELTKVRGTFGFGHGQAYVNDELVCEAKISFAINE